MRACSGAEDTNKESEESKALSSNENGLTHTGMQNGPQNSGRTIAAIQRNVDKVSVLGGSINSI